MDNLFSYTNRDYESTRQEAIKKIPFMSKGAWTDTNTTDPGVIILDHVHALVDMMQYYMDHNALESYISTAKERKNLFRLAKQLGYKINGAKGAQVVVQFSTKRSYDSEYVIPKHTILFTSGKEKIPYLTADDIIMYSGIVKSEVLCIQGVEASRTYQGTGVSSSSSDPNAEDQYVILDNLGVDLDSITVRDSKGYNWKEVDSVTFSNSDAREFSVELLYDGKVKIQFGSGDRGYCPTENDFININYVYSLGSKGRVSKGAIDSISQGTVIVTKSGITVNDLVVTNLNTSTGGSDPEDSELIRKLAPSIIKSQDRAVTLSDFEALAKKVSGVKDAKAYDINNSPDNCQYYEVKVLVLPDSDVDTNVLKTNVYNYLYQKSTPPTVLSIITPSSKIIDISAKVVINSTYTEDAIKYNVSEEITNYFNNLGNTLGGTILPNTLISLISKIDGVLYVEEFTPSGPIVLEDLEIPKLGSLGITVVRRGS